MKIHSIFFTFFFFVALLTAQEKPADKFSGYMFGDYYWVVSHHNSDIENSNGFWFRRIYFTYDHRISRSLSTRLRLEMGSRGDFSTNSSALIPFVKDAYLKWTVNAHHQVYLGISSPPTFYLVEKFWGYRFLEKTPLDLQRWGSSRDFGVMMKGDLLSSGKVRYHFMLGNGSGNKSEVNTGKKFSAAISYYPDRHLVLEVYGDRDERCGAEVWFTYQGFLGYRSEKVRFGLLYSHQLRQLNDHRDENLDLASLFITAKIHKQWGLVGRIDRQFDPNARAESQVYLPFDPNSKSTFFLGGIDFMPHPAVHLMPNVEVIVYDADETGHSPKTDFIPRATFFYIFK